MKNINIRFKQELGDRLKEVSKATKISQNTLVNMAVKELIRQYEGKGFIAKIQNNDPTKESH